MKFVPLFDRLLVRPILQNKANDFGFVLSDISKERPDMGEVIAVADGVNTDYSDCKMFVKIGDKVLFNRFAGAEVELDSEKYIAIRQIDVVGVFDDREEDC